MRTRGEHATHRKAPSQDLNPQPSCCEAAVLPTAPPCRPKL
uniref:Uncharacterized protein n=1 Tax=Anguilla anguilla TaxID=7936 RepID=A0A0E9QB68_ANGAN